MQTKYDMRCKYFLKQESEDKILKDKLKNLLEGHRSLINDYEKIVKEYESNDLINQNEKLQKDLEQYKASLDKMQNKNIQMSKELENLRIALKEQIFDEKLNIIKISRRKIETYFQDLTAEYANSLIGFEYTSKRKLDQLSSISKKELKNEAHEMETDIQYLYSKLQDRISYHKNKFDNNKKTILNDLDSEINSIKKEEITEEILQKRIKQNNLELKIGLSWINKIGIFIILIGIAAATKYSYTNFFNEYMKGIFAFVLGALFLAGGEWFNKKEKSVFSQGLTGGGLGILYYAVFSSYFILNILNIFSSIGICVLITAVALILSIRYNSVTICSFALVGGYLPFFSYVFAFGLDKNAEYVSMLYILILNILALIISMNKKWNIINYFSFILNVPTLIYLVFSMESGLIPILYSVLTFAMYIAITLYYPLKKQTPLNAFGIVLLALNTFISCIIIYRLFDKTNWIDFRGILALLFCLIYYSIGTLTNKHMKNEKTATNLFYLTSFTFAVLIIPFQFGIQWLTFGWLVEGILLIFYGYRNKTKLFEKSGWIIFALCFVAFVFSDVPRKLFSYSIDSVPFFDFRYFVVTVSLLFTLYLYLVNMNKDTTLQYTSKGKLISLFKYINIFNVWFYLIYVGFNLFGKLEKYIGKVYNSSFYYTIIFALLTVLVAYLCKKAPYMYDRVVKYISIFLLILSILTCIILNFNTNVSGNSVQKGLSYVALGILIVFNVLTFFNIKDLIIYFIKTKNLNLEYYPIIISLYLLGTITTILIEQFHLGNYNLLFSLIYLVSSLIIIIYGFSKKFVYMRRFGLGLSVFATAKLFIFDLSNLQTSMKIVSYFAFGLVLIGISFLYQKYKKYIEVIENINEVEN